VVQTVESLHRKHEPLSSNPSAAKKKKKKEAKVEHVWETIR
jgi:hypothetical protein